MTTATATQDAAADLASMVWRTNAAQLPPATLNTARLAVLDTVGCAFGGMAADGVAAVRSLVLDWAGRPLASVWGTGRAVAPAEAAFANAMCGHALDYDDQHPGVLHTSVSVVPAVLAAAETHQVTNLEDLLAAIVLGTEVADRLAIATLDGPGATGWLLTPLCGYFGAAAAAAKVTGLDETGIRHAMGLAYVQASGNGQSTLDGALTKRMQPAFAARGAVYGTELVRRGITAPVDSLEGRRGYFRVYHRDRYSRELLVGGLGESWLLDVATFKPYPCCAWTHTSLECGLRLRERGVDPAQIREVTIGVNQQAYQSTGTPLPRRYEPATEVDAQFSIPYMFALALATGGVRLADFQPDALRRPEIRAVAGKVRVHVDQELDELNSREITGSRTVARLVDGSTVELVIEQPVGFGDRRLTEPDLLRKYDECCRHGGRTPGAAARTAELILRGTGDCAADLYEALREPLDS
jgi:2-methylcitrate dehydratase PrpD